MNFNFLKYTFNTNPKKDRRIKTEVSNYEDKMKE